ncbi:hypothetical protein KAOT1_14892 [Kordia algicida OT-1]|uniref:Uncharacterized protein n=1 Tax=Kordia algicida OT-1 TaxID=391587 RepID=A9DL97_9FLAO|nr:hypothetical protein KAOT1_14892 [Kordia algicida OT-1]
MKLEFMLLFIVFRTVFDKSELTCYDIDSYKIIKKLDQLLTDFSNEK